MRIDCNGEVRDVPEGLTLAEFICDLGLPSERGIAVAVGDEIVPKELWPSRRLEPNNSILIITATQGG